MCIYDLYLLLSLLLLLVVVFNIARIYYLFLFSVLRSFNDMQLAFLANRTFVVTVGLLSWLSSVCPSVRLSICLSSVSHGCTVAKWCKIGPMLLLISNRKSHIGFQMTYKSMTLDDLEGS